MKKKVLVTGAFGQLGNAVLKKFQDVDMLATDLLFRNFLQDLIPVRFWM